MAPTVYTGKGHSCFLINMTNATLKCNIMNSHETSKKQRDLTQIIKQMAKIYAVSTKVSWQSYQINAIATSRQVSFLFNPDKVLSQPRILEEDIQRPWKVCKSSKIKVRKLKNKTTGQFNARPHNILRQRNGSSGRSEKLIINAIALIFCFKKVLKCIIFFK